MFSQVSAVHRWGVRGRGACRARCVYVADGHAWQEACVAAGGMYMWLEWCGRGWHGRGVCIGQVWVGRSLSQGQGCMRKMIIFTYFYMLIICIWLQVINKVKVTHQGEGHIQVKVKYLLAFQFYVAHTVSKQVVCIRLKCILTHYQIAENCVLYGSTDGVYIYLFTSTHSLTVNTLWQSVSYFVSSTRQVRQTSYYKTAWTYLNLCPMFQRPWISIYLSI